MKRIRTFLLVIGWIAIGLSPLARGAAPNILIITVDNLGYGDIKSYNPDSIIKTPRLDQLANEVIWGVR